MNKREEERSSTTYNALHGRSDYRPDSLIAELPVEVKPWSQGWLIAAGAYPGFCSMKRLEVLLLPLDGMLVHRRSLPRNFARFPQQFAGTHLYTWVERGTVRVKLEPGPLAPESSALTMRPPRLPLWFLKNIWSFYRSRESTCSPTNHTAAIHHLKSSPTFSVRPCSSVGRVTVDLFRRSWVRFPPRSKDFFFSSCGSLFPFTRANAQWVIHGFK